MVSFPFHQAQFPDPTQVLCGRAVIENLGRWTRLIAEFNLGRVSLAGPDLLPIGADREPLLVVVGHNVVQFGPRDRCPVRRTREQELVDANPSGTVQHESNFVGPMTQDVAHEFADPGVVPVHCRSHASGSKSAGK